MDLLVDQLLPNLAPYLDRPYAFFGHSMGAFLAFEVARRLEAENVRSPSHVIVSSRRAPHLSSSESLLHTLPDDAFVHEINRRYGGIPAEVAQHPDVLELLLPALRADITALETYRPLSGQPLRCPITALGGVDDPRVSGADLDAWRLQTVSQFETRLFPGGHFYLSDPRAGLFSTVSDALSRLEASPQEDAA
jgi:surfactin synthase thioesterase subunit